jgi:hypothetical protein
MKQTIPHIFDLEDIQAALDEAVGLLGEINRDDVSNERASISKGFVETWAGAVWEAKILTDTMIGALRVYERQRQKNEKAQS